MEHEIKLLSKVFVTHNVKRYIFTKPEGFEYSAGQWVKLYISEENSRPFTMSSTPRDGIIEFTVKTYHERNGFTKDLWDLSIASTLHISNANGKIKFKGPGIFIAAGTGIAPFLAIFRDLEGSDKLNSSALVYSVKTEKDIICEKEIKHYFKNRLDITLSQEESPTFKNGHINKEMIEALCSNPSCYAYICGPRKFVYDMSQIVKEIGIPEASIIND